jgi:hypothetical protein
MGVLYVRRTDTDGGYSMTLPLAEWPYLPTLVRLALALAIGLFMGVECERRGTDSGLRTFGFAALLGGLGGLLGGHMGRG